MKGNLCLALIAIMISSAVTLNAEDKKQHPVYDPMTWKADTIQGIAGYTIPNAKPAKGRKAKAQKQQTEEFLPLKNLATGEVLGKLQPVSISDYSRGWSYVETAPVNASMADNSDPSSKK